MSDHSAVLVPVETWAYSAPKLKGAGTNVDIGLFAEALLYYDRVLLNFTTQPQLADALRWLALQRGWFRRHKGLERVMNLGLYFERAYGT